MGFVIRKLYDATTPDNRSALDRVVEIVHQQIEEPHEEGIQKILGQLHDPFKRGYRAIVFVAQRGGGAVEGFALLLDFPDRAFCFLEYISAAPGGTGRGIGGALYERVREEAEALGAVGVFLECLPDDPEVVKDPALLKQNRSRLRFYERFGARPIVGTAYEEPKHADDSPPYLVFDGLGAEEPPGRRRMRAIVRAILERKYGYLCTPEEIDAYVASFRDDPVRLREPRYAKSAENNAASLAPRRRGIALVVNEKHDIHHVRERGYVEAPVRIRAILKAIEPTGLFERVPARAFGEKPILDVHDAEYAKYLKKACAQVPPGKSVYPYVFPIRNASRPPRDLPVRAGYYCIDTFTPLNANAYLAARGAVDCALTAAECVLEGYRLAYALVRPPGHHAERANFGGFCYFNSAAVAAHRLSRLGRVVVLDVDFHHGNGTQDIFWRRADVLTLSIHGDPANTYPYFTGFADEVGEGKGAGYNWNLPLADGIGGKRYRRELREVLERIRGFDPAFLVVALGLDPAKGDPTGSWLLGAEDFRRNGELLGALELPTLVVQEGGYRTRSLGTHARAFFAGLAATALPARKA